MVLSLEEVMLVVSLVVVVVVVALVLRVLGVKKRAVEFIGPLCEIRIGMRFGVTFWTWDLEADVDVEAGGWIDSMFFWWFCFSSFLQSAGFTLRPCE